MMTRTPITPPSRQPESPEVKKGLHNISLVWIVPVVAVLIGGWLIWREVAAKGPDITVTFLSAEGLTAGKTPVKYRDVTIGTVKDIKLNEYFTEVELTLQMSPEIEPYLTDAAKFWVVRPRVSAQGVTGLETIVSGFYIEMIPDKNGNEARHFKGFDEPQFIEGSGEGTRFILTSREAGSIAQGTPVLLRGVAVGEVLGTELDDTAQNVSVPVFVRAPYDALIKSSTRFWDSSGISLDLNAEGFSVRAQSIRSVIAGGVNFYTPDGDMESEAAPVNTVFPLYGSRKEAETLAYGISQQYILYFDSSVRGLSVGAPVEFRGIRVGEVESVDLEYVSETNSFRVPVVINMQPERVVMVGAENLGAGDYADIAAQLVRQGMRARLKTGSFITGQLYVDLDVYAMAPARYLGDGSSELTELPTLQQKSEEISQSLSSLLEKIETFPIEEIGIRLLGTVEGMENIVTSPAIEQGMNSISEAAAGINQLVTNLDTSVVPATRDALNAAEMALGGVRDMTAPNSPVRYNFEEALKELSAAARSLRTLADYLEQNPNALILGKSGNQETTP
ncbi:intermembrane transport protein PqiB [Thalassospira sp.]|uniref:PqiB family protein n=1 Tax=Thalassospira sp. TaxID=1912094 RepID=UPI0027348253|nr:MlaD family protein [Thalassospira sp.]MDP2698057.1 MlaD family protein [Thalassospira sp.]